MVCIQASTKNGLWSHGMDSLHIWKRNINAEKVCACFRTSNTPNQTGTGTRFLPKTSSNCCPQFPDVNGLLLKEKREVHSAKLHPVPTLFYILKLLQHYKYGFMRFADNCLLNWLIFYSGPVSLELQLYK